MNNTDVALLTDFPEGASRESAGGRALCWVDGSAGEKRDRGETGWTEKVSMEKNEIERRVQGHLGAFLFQEST